MSLKWRDHYAIVIEEYIARLLGHPQPQMYPPVALNQYTWVNRTHKKKIIFASGPHENFPKLSSNNM